MQADAEHQQHDADLGQLSGDDAIGDEAGGEGADRDPRDQVADQRGQAQAMGEEAEEERQGKTDGDGGNERDIMRHASLPVCDGPAHRSASYVLWMVNAMCANPECALRPLSTILVRLVSSYDKQGRYSSPPCRLGALLRARSHGPTPAASPSGARFGRGEAPVV